MYVTTYMKKSPVTVRPEDTIAEVKAIMAAKQFRHLPVVEGSKVLGMISIRDIMNDIIAGQEQTISQLTNYISS